jgi:hypothetical protein
MGDQFDGRTQNKISYFLLNTFIKLKHNLDRLARSVLRILYVKKIKKEPIRPQVFKERGVNNGIEICNCLFRQI